MTTTELINDLGFAKLISKLKALFTIVTDGLIFVDATSSIQDQLDSKAPIANPTFTGTVSGVTKTMVSLGNADNTSDANKPVSTAQQTALNLKANLASPTFTGVVALGTYTVATLPTPTGTAYATVTDATAPTYLGALIGGGAVVCPVFFDGTVWVSH